jgi:hypothetical protein
MMHFLFPVLLGRIYWNRHIHQLERFLLFVNAFLAVIGLVSVLAIYR